MYDTLATAHIYPCLGSVASGDNRNRTLSLAVICMPVQSTHAVVFQCIAWIYLVIAGNVKYVGAALPLLKKSAMSSMQFYHYMCICSITHNTVPVGRNRPTPTPRNHHAYCLAPHIVARDLIYHTTAIQLARGMWLPRTYITYMSARCVPPSWFCCYAAFVAAGGLPAHRARASEQLITTRFLNCNADQGCVRVM